MNKAELFDAAQAIHISLDDIAEIANHFRGLGFSCGAKDEAARGEARAAEAVFALIERETQRLSEAADSLAFDIKEMVIVNEGGGV